MAADACPGAAHMRIHACQVAAVDRRRKEQKEPKSPATHGRTHGWRVSERVTGRERMDARGSGKPAPVRAWGDWVGLSAAPARNPARGPGWLVRRPERLPPVASAVRAHRDASHTTYARRRSSGAVR
jgi:hypothetical protein